MSSSKKKKKERKKGGGGRGHQKAGEEKRNKIFFDKNELCGIALVCGERNIPTAAGVLVLAAAPA